jgi:ribonuclease VapC
MVIDTCALLAILLAEADAEVYAHAIEEAEDCRMSAAKYLEAALVIDSKGDAVASREFDLFLRRADIAIGPVTLEQARIARLAYRDFGKGRHPAELNFGDCFSYALAKSVGEPLLFKGADFVRTDVERTLPVQP